MSRSDPDFGLILTLCRLARGFPHQVDLALVAGMPPSVISAYESGARRPHLRNLGRLLKALHLDHSAIDAGREFLERLRAVDPEPGENDGAHASNLAARLCRHPKAVQKALAEESEEFQVWALAELLCEESSRLAAHDARLALDRAEIAVTIADRVPGTRSFRLHVSSRAWAHLAHALRVAGNLPAADSAFEKADQLATEAGGEPPEFLSVARVLGMKASLRRDQRRLSESLVLLDRALTAGPDEGLELSLLLHKALSREVMGDIRGAIAILHEIGPRIEKSGNRHLRFCLTQNKLDFLSKAGHFEEAAALLHEAESLSDATLDRLRLRWSEARITAGLGEVDRAIHLFLQVRSGFMNQRISYDVALVSLELSMLYLSLGRQADVKQLARHLVPIFQAQGVPPEAQVALGVFRKAAEAERLAGDLLRRVFDFCYRARHIEGLRFNG